MANTLLKIKMIGNQISQRAGLFSLDADFSKLSFFEIDNADLESAFVKKWQRSLTKDGIIAIKCLEKIVDSQAVTAKPGRLGIYGAFINGPILYSELDQLANIDIEANFLHVKKNWPPKQHFRQTAPLKLAHLSFIFKNQGPLYCFTNPFMSLVDSLQAAEVDLYNKTVDQAIVVSAFSLEDPLQIYLYQQYGTKTFYESGVALLLESNGELINYTDDKKRAVDFNYGMCSPYLNIC